jgi:hypothetical protein
MSSQDDIDVDIDVVSSPEPSIANTTDDETPENSYSIGSKNNRTSSAALAASLLTAPANLSPSTLQNLQNHSAQLLNSQYHSQLSNSLLNHSSNNKENHISASECGRLSPPRTPETNNNNNNNINNINNINSSKLSPSTTTTHSGFTSFSISSILSRQDSPNKRIVAPVPSFPINGSQDVMISR